jgi:hypothetical protein
MSQSDKFYENYSNIEDNLTYSIIPTKQTYDKIVAFLVDKVNPDESIKETTLRNWRHR